jgi:hypothetical protein
MARPLKLTPELHAAIVDRIAQGNYPEVAAQAEGIDRATFYRWMAAGVDAPADDPRRAFCDAVKAAKARVEADTVAQLRAGAQGWQALAWWLERTRPERYASDRRKKAAEIKALKGDKSTGPVRVVLEYEHPRVAPAVSADASADRDRELPE